jgi:hypothetical protein
LKQRLWELKFSLVQGRGAVLKTGLAPLDLRHTFNTNMRKAEVDHGVIMKITGHKTTAMFDRYNTVDSEDARSAMDRYEGFLRNQITSGLLHALPEGKKEGLTERPTHLFHWCRRSESNRHDCKSRGILSRFHGLRSPLCICPQTKGKLGFVKGI